MREKYCANASKQAKGLSVPGCVSNPPTISQTIYYDEHGIDTDTNRLCDSCAERVRELAQKHGYRIEESELAEQ